MTDPLLICPACARHVRANEHACPFCSAPLAARGGSLFGRATAGALLAVAAVASLAACYGVPEPPDASRTDAPSGEAGD